MTATTRQTGPHYRKLGAPTKMDAPVGQRKDGTPITVADRIIDAVRAGAPIDQAAAAAGINRDTLHRWLREGARAMTLQLKAQAAGQPRPTLTSEQRRQADFSDRVYRAQAEATVEDVALTAKVARGGAKLVTTTTKKDHDGNVLESTTKEETLAPDGAMLRWRLRTRHPDLFGDGPNRVEITGAEGGPVEVLTLAEKRAAVLAQLGAIGARLTEPEPDYDAPLLPELEASTDAIDTPEA